MITSWIILLMTENVTKPAADGRCRTSPRRARCVKHVNLDKRNLHTGASKPAQTATCHKADVGVCSAGSGNDSRCARCAVNVERERRKHAGRSELERSNPIHAAAVVLEVRARSQKVVASQFQCLEVFVVEAGIERESDITCRRSLRTAAKAERCRADVETGGVGRWRWKRLRHSWSCYEQQREQEHY